MSNHTTSRWGASLAEWAHFRAMSEPDLLPVVSDPGAEVHPVSKMKELGKTPSRWHEGKVVGIAGWTEMQATKQQVDAWVREDTYGIAFQTRLWRAIDIDTEDQAEADSVQATIEAVLGPLQWRTRAGSPRRLALVRVPGTMQKVVVKTKHGMVEFLANGQQCIVAGTHPKGMRYEWLGGPPTGDGVSAAEFDALRELVALEHGVEAPVAARAALSVGARSAADIADPDVAWLEAKGWVTDWAADGRVDVRCPWEAEHTSDTGASSTSYYPAGVGGQAQAGFKCLHAHCASRGIFDFRRAVGLDDPQDDFEVLEPVAVATVGPAPVVGEPEPEEDWPQLSRDKNGKIEALIDDVCKAVACRGMSGVRLAKDTFRDQEMVDDGRGAWRIADDNTNTDLRRALQRRGFKHIPSEMMRDAMKQCYRDNSFDSAMEWARGLVWDGTPRVAHFWQRYYQVEDSAYAQAVSTYTWTALAARLLEPGAKCDMVPVLVGIQGAGKTSSIEVISPIDEAFAEIDMSKKDDDLARQIKGKLVCELAELRGLSSRESESIKAWISRRFEEWIPKYEEKATRYGRRCIFFGTANGDEILDDPTGERRWLPMRVGTVDVAAVARDRDQLWAEGIALFRQQGVAWREAYALAKAQHADFKVVDAWQERIEAWLEGDDFDGPRADSGVQYAQIFASALGLRTGEQNRVARERVRRVMTNLGWCYLNLRVAGQQRKAWFKPGATAKALSAKNCALSDFA